MSNDAYKVYSDYLGHTSRVGRLYRKSLLFPVLARHLTGYVCDVGCGVGDFLAYRPDTIGIDVNPYNIEICRKRGLSADVISGGQYPFADATFDSAVANHVIEHLVDPALLLLETHRVLKPGGLFVVGVPGQKGFEFDLDHKVYYDYATLDRVLRQFSFLPKKKFHLPLPFRFLSGVLRQFSLYVVAMRV